MMMAVVSGEEPEPFGWDSRGYETTFVENLRALRIRQGMSQSELARRAQDAGLLFHQPTVQRIENGERPVKLTEAFVLAEIVGSDLHALTTSMSLPFAYERLVEQLAPTQLDDLYRDAQIRVHDLDRRRGELIETLEAYKLAAGGHAEPDPRLTAAAGEMLQAWEAASTHARAELFSLAATRAALLDKQTTTFNFPATYSPDPDPGDTP